MQPILLSGRPGAGKSTYAQWLETHHEFKRVDTDSEPQQSKWWQLINGAHTSAGAAAMHAEAEALGTKVVIEWGFPPDPSVLAIVTNLRDAGFDTWWLDCDEAIGRERYVCSKGNSPAVMAAYNTQTGKIGAAWEALESFYGSGHIIRTDPPEGAYRPFEEIATVMFPDAL